VWGRGGEVWIKLVTEWDVPASGPSSGGHRVCGCNHGRHIRTFSELRQRRQVLDPFI